MNATQEAARIFVLNLGNTVIKGAGDLVTHHLDLVGQDANRDARLIHALDMGIQVFSGRMEGQADFIGDDAFTARLFCEPIK